jgi:hypothetical protein
VIIVGIAIAVGLTMFRAYVMNSNRQAVLSDLNLMSASIIAYFKTPTTQGGGVYDIEKISMYLGYQYYPAGDSLTTGNGNYLFSYGMYGTLTIQGFGTEIGNDGENRVKTTMTISPYINNISVLVNN